MKQATESTGNENLEEVWRTQELEKTIIMNW